jgi:hypothetical protein
MTRLLDYPYVRLRIGCDACQRRGSYRLARLAEKYGAAIELDDLLAQLTGDCARRMDERAVRNSRTRPMVCHAALIDMKANPRPPDLPPGLFKLRLVSGGNQ